MTLAKLTELTPIFVLAGCQLNLLRLTEFNFSLSVTLLNETLMMSQKAIDCDTNDPD